MAEVDGGLAGGKANPALRSPRARLVGRKDGPKSRAVSMTSRAKSKVFLMPQRMQLLALTACYKTADQAEKFGKGMVGNSTSLARRVNDRAYKLTQSLCQRAATQGSAAGSGRLARVTPHALMAAFVSQWRRTTADLVAIEGTVPVFAPKKDGNIKGKSSSDHGQRWFSGPAGTAFFPPHPSSAPKLTVAQIRAMYKDDGLDFLFDCPPVLKTSKGGDRIVDFNTTELAAHIFCVYAAGLLQSCLNLGPDDLKMGKSKKGVLTRPVTRTIAASRATVRTENSWWTLESVSATGASAVAAGTTKRGGNRRRAKQGALFDTDRSGHAVKTAVQRASKEEGKKIVEANPRRPNKAAAKRRRRRSKSPDSGGESPAKRRPAKSGGKKSGKKKGGSR